jgi:hypothetical protein
MSDTLTTLVRPVELDTKGWDLPFGELRTPKRGAYPYHYVSDELFESPDKNFACLFYTINEIRMGWYCGLMSVFENKQNPTLLANPNNQWFDYQGDRSLVFSDNYLFVRKPAFNENEKLSGTPFVILDLTKKIFGFIDFDATSIYYSPIKINDTIFKFNLDTPTEIKSMTVPNRHGEFFDVSKIKFYTFDKLSGLLELYFGEKKYAC